MTPSEAAFQAFFMTYIAPPLAGAFALAAIWTIKKVGDFFHAKAVSTKSPIWGALDRLDQTAKTTLLDAVKDATARAQASQAPAQATTTVTVSATPPSVSVPVSK